MQFPRIFSSTTPSAIRTGTTASLLALGLCASSQAGAAPAEEGSSWGLGLAAFSEQPAYAGIDRDTTALPLIYFENKYVRVFGPGAEFKVYGVDLGAGQRLDFRLVAQYDGSEYKGSDAPILSGMAERKAGFWAGGKVKWETGVANVSAGWLADVSGNSKGALFNVAVEKNWRAGEHVMLTPRIGATWADKKYVDYYYGVRASEARAGRPAYTGKSGVNAEVGLRATYLFNAHQSMFLDLGVSRLAKPIKDSPLVDRSTENRVGLGYLYRF
ncbi:MAG TPA: MipA/OmpV family protein [Telluria sp.]|jgi:outer membrane protein